MYTPFFIFIMTVKELITQLLEYPMNMEVKILSEEDSIFAQRNFTDFKLVNFRADYYTGKKWNNYPEIELKNILVIL